MFEYTYGDVGSGKSATLAIQIQNCLNESLWIQKKFKKKREIWVNMPLSPKIMEKYKDRIYYWDNPYKMIFVNYPYNTEIRRDFDCFIDELAEYLPADKWKDTPMQLRRFFRRHRKRGIRIFGNTQDYKMLDINARRMATKVWKTRKLIGSPDPSPTLPPIKLIWGILLKRELDKKSVEEDVLDPKTIGLPRFYRLDKNLVNFYDMRDEVADLEEPELIHHERVCKKCGKVHITHT